MKGFQVLIIPTLCVSLAFADGKIQVVGDGADGGAVVESAIELRSSAQLPPIQTEVKTELFEMRSQKAVVAWNGKTETMLLTSESVSVTGKDETTIGVVPLPGKVLDLKYVPQETLSKIESLLLEKLPEKGRGVAVMGGLDALPQVPVADPYSVFVLKIDEFDKLAVRLNDKAKSVLKQNVGIALSEKNEKVLKRYFDNGFRYFMFDISPLFSEYRQKHAILVQFESSYAFYPLAVGAINGTGRSVVELVVVTPEDVRLSEGFEKELKNTETRSTILGNQSVDLTFVELADIDAILFKLFEGTKTVKACKFMFSLKNINAFGDDFQAE